MDAAFDERISDFAGRAVQNVNDRIAFVRLVVARRQIESRRDLAVQARLIGIEILTTLPGIFSSKTEFSCRTYNASTKCATNSPICARETKSRLSKWRAPALKRSHSQPKIRSKICGR